MRKALFLLLIIASCSVFAQEASISIDVDKKIGEISPYIYGSNDHRSPDFLTSKRQGGNRYSTYNWENNNSNAGKDYNHNSDKHLVNNLSSDEKNKFGAAPYFFVEKANSKKQYSLVTIQAGGYVAADANKEVLPAETAPSLRWKKVEIEKEGELLLSPNLDDDIVYMEEFVNYMVSTMGVAGNGGPNAYSIDNEPSLWNSTHPYMHPGKATFAEVINKSIAVGKMVKSIDKRADVVGPALAGYKAIRTLEEASDKTTYNVEGYLNAPNAENWFFDEYLKAMKTASDEAGVRLLDVVDVHWYPEEKASGERIVDLFKSNPSADDKERMTTGGMVYRRLQAPRVLWDSSYVHTSWFNNDRICLLPNLMKKIEDHFPGTKLGVTEFKYDAEYHFSGGVALVDVLGIFGREGVYLANKWDPVYDYAETAYKMYLDYDDNGSTYGNIALETKWDDFTSFSSYASLDDEDKLHIIAINKTDRDTTIAVSIKNGLYTSGDVYAFGKFSKEIQQLEGISNLENNASFSYTLKAYSANHIVLNPLERARIVSAEATALNKVVVATDMELLSAQTIDVTSFTITNGITDISVLSAEATENDKITLTLSEALTANDNSYVVNFSGNIYDISNNPLYHCFNKKIVQTNVESDPYVVNAEVTTYGKTIELGFSKELSSTQLNADAFTIAFADSSIHPSTVEVSGNIITLHFVHEIHFFQDLQISFANETIVATDNSSISSFLLENDDIENNGPGSEIEIESVSLENFGWQVAIKTNKVLDELSATNNGLHIYVNGEERSFNTEKDLKEILLHMHNRIEYGDEILLSYNEQDVLRSIHGGLLKEFNNMQIVNSLKEPPAPSTLPAKIQAEDILYADLTEAKTESNGMDDQDNTVHYAFTSANDLFVYEIINNEEKEYILTVRHSSPYYDCFKIILDNQQIDSIFVPRTGKYGEWESTSMYITIPSGEHNLGIQMKYGSVNFNWFSIGIDTDIPNAEVTSSQTSLSGKQMELIFSNELENIPNTDAFEFIVNQTPATIVSIDSAAPNAIKIIFKDTIYKGQTVQLNIDDTKVAFRFGIELGNTSIDVKNVSRIQNPTTINNIDKSSLKAFPNPALQGKEITIKIPEYFSSNIKLELISSNGTIIKSKSLKQNGLAVVEIPKRTSGLVTISISDGIHSEKTSIIIQ